MASEPLLLTSSIEADSDNFRSNKPRQRSSAYPSYTINFCVEFTKKFHQHFGNSTYNQREEIAKVLKVSVGHMQTQLSSSVYYGLVDMKQKIGYKISASFLGIYKPIDEEEKHQALIDCLLRPELYKKLLKQFGNNTVPSVSALSTILFRNHNIAEAASEGAAETFIQNLRDLNIIDVDNYLLLDREIGGDDGEQNASAIKEPPKNNDFSIQVPEVKVYEVPKKSNVETLEEIPETYPILIPLKEGRLARLIVPKNYTNEDLNKITKFIEALRE